MFFPALLPYIRYASQVLLMATIFETLTHSAFAQTKPKVSWQATCPLTKSIYRAIAKPDFELIFGPSKSGIASEIATFTLKHKTRGNIVAYNLGGSMGYGGLYLAPVGQKQDEDSSEKLKPYFFDGNWKHINGMTNPVPRYLFVAGLGVEDWYSTRKGNRTKPLGDVMWRFERCQS